MTRICMIVFSHYPADPRVRREAEALIQAGMSVDVIALKGLNDKSKETVTSVNIYRLPVHQKRAGKFRYILEYCAFIILAFLKLSMLHLPKKYDIIHVHNMPDILVLSSLLPKLMGAKIILDLHDPMPELFMTKYALGSAHFIINALKFLEKVSIHYADLVLTPNIGFRELFIQRGCPPEKIHIILNSPQEEIFHKRHHNTKKVSPNDQFDLMYHGLIAERNGLDTALKAISYVCNKIPNIKFHVFGNGDSFVKTFLDMVAQLELFEIVQYYGHVPLETISETIESINVGIIPNKKTPFTDNNLPTRIFEYLCKSRPVIAPRTKGILDYFPENALYFFEPGDAMDLANVILKVRFQCNKSDSVLSEGVEIYRRHRWELEKQQFINIIKSFS